MVVPAILSAVCDPLNFLIRQVTGYGLHIGLHAYTISLDTPLPVEGIGHLASTLSSKLVCSANTSLLRIFPHGFGRISCHQELISNLYICTHLDQRSAAIFDQVKYGVHDRLHIPPVWETSGF